MTVVGWPGQRAFHEGRFYIVDRRCWTVIDGVLVQSDDIDGPWKPVPPANEISSELAKRMAHADLHRFDHLR